MSSETLHRRLREMRARAAIRKWEARQINHARGAWFRFELLLAHAERALAVTPEEVEMLRASGIEEDPIGGEFEPRKFIFVISADRLPLQISGRDVPLQDKRRILMEPALVLFPFSR